jgi:type IV pilus assembly protein PilB
MRDRATDIHVEPMEKELRIRYRIDGMLYEAPIPAGDQEIPGRDHFAPQDHGGPQHRRAPPAAGRQDQAPHGRQREFDLRVPRPCRRPTAKRSPSVSFRATRTLDAGDVWASCEAHKASMRQMILQAATASSSSRGPRAPGKSTTLYAALSEINHDRPQDHHHRGPDRVPHPRRDADPGEPGRSTSRSRACCARPCAWTPTSSWSVKRATRKRRKITIATAMTGHLVFSTLHTNDACGAFTRLERHGRGALPHRLRPWKACSRSASCAFSARNCKQRLHRPEPSTCIRTAEHDGEDASGHDRLQARTSGCEALPLHGLRGRTVIVEMVKMNENDSRRKIVSDSCRKRDQARRHEAGHAPHPLQRLGEDQARHLTTIERSAPRDDGGRVQHATKSDAS